MDLLLAAILLVPQDPPAPAQEPQAAFTAWLQSLPAEHPRPFKQELELDFDLAFEDLAGDEEALGYYESVLPDMEFDLRMRLDVLDADRFAFRMRGNAQVSVAAEPDQTASASGELGLIFDGGRIHGWVDGKESVTEESLREGFTFDQVVASKLYAEVLAALPELLALMPEDELPVDMENLQRMMPPTLADYLHPRGYWLASFHLLEAISFERTGDSVRTRLRPNARLADGMTASLVAEAEDLGLESEKALELARGVVKDLDVLLELDHATGLPLGIELRMVLPLELMEADITGRAVFAFRMETVAWEPKAPAAERFAPPEGIKWFDADIFLPIIRLGLEQALGKPDTSEEDFEF